MTVRVHNDDPRCQSPTDCQIGALHFNVCRKCSLAARAKKAVVKLASVRKPWSCPAGFEDLYLTIKRKVGMSTARRLIDRDAARAQRRAGTA